MTSQHTDPPSPKPPPEEYGMGHIQQRAKGFVEIPKIQELLKDKFFCHIGCHTGHFIYEASKHCKKALGIEITDDEFFSSATSRE